MLEDRNTDLEIKMSDSKNELQRTKDNESIAREKLKKVEKELNCSIMDAKSNNDHHISLLKQYNQIQTAHKGCKTTIHELQETINSLKYEKDQKEKELHNLQSKLIQEVQQKEMKNEHNTNILTHTLKENELKHKNFLKEIETDYASAEANVFKYSECIIEK